MKPKQLEKMAKVEGWCEELKFWRIKRLLWFPDVVKWNLDPLLQSRMPLVVLVSDPGEMFQSTHYSSERCI